MPFEKGHAKKGGRRSGSPNKTTADIKTRIAALVDDQFVAISTDLELLDPKDRVSLYLRFLDFVIPRQREQKIALNSYRSSAARWGFSG